MKAGREKVVIIIISYKRNLLPREQIALQECYKALGQHPIRIVCPRGLDVSEYRKIEPTAVFDFIPPEWQESYASFNRLMIEPFLYQRYRHFQYILFYQPDAFVFRDELLSWCNKGYDYIGAPWFADCGNNPDGVYGGLGMVDFHFVRQNRICEFIRTLSFLRHWRLTRNISNYQQAQSDWLED